MKNRSNIRHRLPEWARPVENSDGLQVALGAYSSLGCVYFVTESACFKGYYVLMHFEKCIRDHGILLQFYII